MTEPAAPGDPTPAGPPPAAADLLALPADAWAWWLPLVRAALHAVPEDEATPVVRRLRAAPTSRLAGGRSRRELVAVLAAGGTPWRELVERTVVREDVPAAVTTALTGGPPTTASTVPGRATPAGRDDAALEAARRETARAKQRARTLLGERDEARRRKATAEARVVALEGQLHELEEALVEERRARRAAEDRLADTAGERERAVARERRRRDGEVARLQEQLRTLRRQEEERQAAGRRRAEAAAEADREARRATARQRERRAVRPRLVPGRPSQLPDGVEPGTTEATELLLHRGRLVLVDGYNVTLQHRGELDLAGQRAWLTGALGTLVARRGVRAVVVFDSADDDAGRPGRPPRGVEVRFSPAGITADDELVLAVSATDEPVTVITDDRELIARLRAEGADVVATAPFVWVLR